MTQRTVYLSLATGVAALGGLLFGYDTAVISGAIGDLQAHFRLDDVGTGWAGASAVVGAIPGALAAGFLSDRFGRRRVLFACAILFLLSGIGAGIPITFWQFIVARLFGGFAIGASSMVCPTYIAELAPEKLRGRLGTLFQLGIVTGIFAVFFVNYLIQHLGSAPWNVEMGWRWMLGSEAIPAVAFFALIIFATETPRWLLQNGREAEAERIFAILVGPDRARQEMAAIAQVSGEEEGQFREIFQHPWTRPLLIAVVLGVLGQLCGINAVMYYAPELFKQGGTSDAAYLSAVWIGGINFLFTFVTIICIDKFGRKPLLLLGTAVQTLCLAGVGWEFYTHRTGTALLLGILGFTAAFAASTGPICWVFISEVFPGRVRGRATSVAVFAVWTADYVVAQTFPILNQHLGSAGTFWIYCGCSLIAFLFIARFVPETKGRTLEEIELSWRNRPGIGA